MSMMLDTHLRVNFPLDSEMAAMALLQLPAAVWQLPRHNKEKEMNREALRKTIDIITIVNGEGFDMLSWTLGDAGAIVSLIRDGKVKEAKKEVSCGTGKACVAGWTETWWTEDNPFTKITRKDVYKAKGWEVVIESLGDAHFFAEPATQGDAAMLILGLTNAEAGQLFYADNGFWRDNGAKYINGEWNLTSDDAIKALTGLLDGTLTLDEYL